MLQYSFFFQFPDGALPSPDRTTGSATGSGWQQKQYSLPQKKVYIFVEPSTQNWGGPDEK